MSVSVVVPTALTGSTPFYHMRVLLVEGSKGGREMRLPNPPLAPVRRGIVAAIVVATAIAAGVSVHDGSVSSRWTNAAGVLLGSLAGAYIGEYLQRFGGRVAATSLSWIKMAAIAVFFAALLSVQSLPAYCQLPLAFAAGIIVTAATVYIRYLETPLS